MSFSPTLKKMSWLACGALLAVNSAHASRSSVYPNTSLDISIYSSFQRDAALKDGDGKPVTLTREGLLLNEGEDAGAFSKEQRSHRTVDRFDISFDPNTKKSYVRLRTEGSMIEAGTSREVRFYLPTQIEIDSDGRPENLGGVSATAAETGQNLALKFTLTQAGDWIPYHHEYDESCTIRRVRTHCRTEWRDICDGPRDDRRGGDGRGGRGDERGHDGGDRGGRGDDRGGSCHRREERVCHDEIIEIPGHEHVVVDGSDKSDSYSTEIESLLNTRFNLNYTTRYTSTGPCIMN